MQDLSKYTLAKLRALEVEIVEELKTRHYLSVSQAREQILHIAQGAGLSVEQLLSKKAPKTAKQSDAQPKYRNPDDPTQQWSGRGRQPGWAKALIASGKSLDDAKV